MASSKGFDVKRHPKNLAGSSVVSTLKPFGNDDPLLPKGLPGCFYWMNYD